MRDRRPPRKFAIRLANLQQLPENTVKKGGGNLYLIVQIIVTANYDDGLILLTFFLRGGTKKNKQFIRDFL